MINVDMPTKEGVTLATSGKYCEDNIKVTPSFEVEDSQANALIQYSDFDTEGYPHTATYCPKDNTTKLPNIFFGQSHQYAFSKYLERVTTLNIPETVTEIGNTVLFSKRLSILSNWENITYFGDGNFYGNGVQVGQTIYGLNYDHLPPNLTHIGSTCFRGGGHKNCPIWTSLPETLTYLGTEAFAYINSGSKLLLIEKLPNNLEYLGNNCLQNNGYPIFTCKTLHIPESLVYFGATSLGGAAMNVEKIIFDGTPSTVFQNAVKGISPNGLGSRLDKLSELYVPWAEGTFTTEPFGCKNANLIIYRYSDWVDSVDGITIEAGTSCFKYNGKLYKAIQSGTLTEWDNTFFEEVV